MAQPDRPSPLIPMPTAQQARAQRVPAAAKSLGQRSRSLKRRTYLRRLARAFVAAVGVWIAALIVGFAVNGLGIGGLIVTFFVMAAVFAGLLLFPRLRAPSPTQLQRADLGRLAGQTELFLETQRPLLPPPAQDLLDRIGVELDQLSPQLETIGERDAAAHEVRRLLGEHLPALIESYTRIPEPLRGRPNAGATPEQQLVGGLEVISREIGTMTGQIARGELDALATRGRYLETRYVAAAAPESAPPR